MPSSKAKKAAKKADFQKPKLKVGKARPKASNVTDTSFRTKGIVLKTQSLSTSLPSLDEKIPIYLAHLSSRSEGQRKEALAALINAATRTALPSHVVLDKVLPLITDGNVSVRENMIRLLQTLRADECRGFEDKVVLYLQTGLTHISSGVCRSALDLLTWAAETYGDALVACRGGWYKILKCFLLLLGWKGKAVGQKASQEWSGGGLAIEKLTKDSKLTVKILDSFAAFINLGLAQRGNLGEVGAFAMRYPPHMRPHLVPVAAKPFARLDLFAPPPDVENQNYDDVQARKTIFQDQFQDTIQPAALVAKRQGGEIGRAAGNLAKAVNPRETDR